jgi:hemolysin III
MPAQPLAWADVHFQTADTIAWPTADPGRCGQPDGGPGIETPVERQAQHGAAPAVDPAPRLRGVSHLLAFVVVLPLGALLGLSAHGSVARTAAITFAASVAGMFGVSSLFHRIAWTERAKRWLGRIDHTMIYTLIAGTYTPIALLVLHGGWRIPILATVWGCALAAAIVKFVWCDAPRWVAPVTCVSFGWIAVALLPQIVTGIGPAGVVLLLVGGVAYVVGAVVYARRRPDPRPRTFGYHEVFHLLVIVAVACQYATMAFFVVPRA